MHEIPYHRLIKLTGAIRDRKKQDRLIEMMQNWELKEATLVTGLKDYKPEKFKKYLKERGMENLYRSDTLDPEEVEKEKREAKSNVINAISTFQEGGE